VLFTEGHMPITETKKNDSIGGGSKDYKKIQNKKNEASICIKDFFDFLPLSVCYVSPTGMIENINSAFEGLSGLTETEAVGEYLPKFFLETEKIKKLLKKDITESIIENEEFTLITKREEEIVVNLSIAKKRNEQGSLSGYFLSIKDISAQKKIQQETEKKIKTRTRDLEESRRAVLNILEDTEYAKIEIEQERSRTQIILNNFLDGLLIFGSDKKIWSINPKAEEFLNIKREDAIGKTMVELGKITGIKELVGAAKKRRESI